MSYLMNGLVAACMICGVFISSRSTQFGVPVEAGEASAIYGTCVTPQVLSTYECSAACGGFVRVQILTQGGSSSLANAMMCVDNYQCTARVDVQKSCSGG